MAKKKRSKQATEALGEYRRKRDFERTAEPRGEAAASPTGSLYVIQKHAARNLHYDLRLELDGTLKSWAVPRGPSLDPKQKPLAVLVEDHPIEYGDFEGIIPKGEYGGGTVMLWDHGVWEPIGDPREGLARGDLKFRLHGEKLRGEWVLARMSGRAGEDGKNWLLIKKRDDAARSVESYNVLAEMPYSVTTGRTMDEITTDPEAVWRDGRAEPVSSKGAARRPVTRTTATPVPRGPDPAALPNTRKGAPPEILKPQLASASDRAPEGDGWLHEIKLDGYRMLCHLDGGVARLMTRNGHDWTDRMPALARALATLPIGSAVLDGEVVVLDERGIADFQALQNAFRGRRGGPLTYFAFDVPFAGGFDLRKVPLLERKAFLRELLEAGPETAPAVQYCDHIVGRGPIVHEQAYRSGLEGIVSKRADASYESRRSTTWLKVKCRLREEFVVGGFTPPSGSRSGFGALLIGQHDEAGRLVYCGRVGSGFSDAALDELSAELGGRATETPPFANARSDPDHRIVQWTEPALVVEVEFTAWTNERLVRHAVFLGVRGDKDPSEVVFESAAAPRGPRGAPPAPSTSRVVQSVIRTPRTPDDAYVAGVRISHPDRTVYPEARVTKRAVAEYYEAVAPWILPHLVRRPLSLVRCPLGLAGESFYQRSLGKGFPDAIHGMTYENDEGETEDTIYIEDLDGLLSLVQMGVLEIHPWGARIDNLERPDRMILDLDPGPGIAWGDVVGAAGFIRGYLADLGLESFAKTSGGSGVHIVVPLVRRAGWDEVKAFAHGIAVDLVRIAPRNFVATMAKTARKLRIYVDYLRNHRGSTAVGPYSTRARPGATVSTPLAWDELSPDLKPTDLTVKTVPVRLASLEDDPWAGMIESRQSITVAMKRAVGM